MCILMKIILKILLIINYSLIFANINLIKNIFKMKELIEKINTEFASFTTEANAQVEKGNKAAGTRARKNALELSKLFKEFRKLSVEESKK